MIRNSTEKTNTRNLNKLNTNLYKDRDLKKSFKKSFTENSLKNKEKNLSFPYKSKLKGYNEGNQPMYATLELGMGGLSPHPHSGEGWAKPNPPIPQGRLGVGVERSSFLSQPNQPQRVGVKQTFFPSRGDGAGASPNPIISKEDREQQTNNRLIILYSKFLSLLMKNGEKSKSERIVYQTLNKINQKINLSNLNSLISEKNYRGFNPLSLQAKTKIFQKNDKNSLKESLQKPFNEQSYGLDNVNERFVFKKTEIKYFILQEKKKNTACCKEVLSKIGNTLHNNEFTDPSIFKNVLSNEKFLRPKDYILESRSFNKQKMVKNKLPESLSLKDKENRKQNPLFFHKNSSVFTNEGIFPCYTKREYIDYKLLDTFSQNTLFLETKEMKETPAYPKALTEFLRKFILERKKKESLPLLQGFPLNEKTFWFSIFSKSLIEKGVVFLYKNKKNEKFKSFLSKTNRSTQTLKTKVKKVCIKQEIFSLHKEFSKKTLFPENLFVGTDSPKDFLKLAVSLNIFTFLNTITRIDNYFKKTGSVSLLPNGMVGGLGWANPNPPICPTIPVGWANPQSGDGAYRLGRLGFAQPTQPNHPSIAQNQPPISQRPTPTKISALLEKSYKIYSKNNIQKTDCSTKDLVYSIGKNPYKGSGLFFKGKLFYPKKLSKEKVLEIPVPSAGKKRTPLYGWDKKDLNLKDKSTSFHPYRSLKGNTQKTDEKKYNKILADSLCCIRILEESIKNVRPSIELRKVKRGRNTYTVPSLIKTKRGEKFGIQWILESAKKRRRKNKEPLHTALGAEVLQAFQKTGYGREKRNALFQQANLNRAYLRYRWW